MFRSYNYPLLRYYAATGEALPFDLDHMAAVIAPRPFLNIDATEDPMVVPNRSELQAAEREITRLYDRLGVGDRFKCIEIEGPHA